MTETTTNLDFNTAGGQRKFEVIPANTVVTLQATINRGGAGDGGWLKLASDSLSEGLDCEFTVVDGEYAKRKVWQRLTLRGTTPGHAEAGEISRNMLRAILESARGIRPDDKSEKAQNARRISGWQDLDQVRFMARLGVMPPKDGFQAKNTILEVITPDRQAWKQPEQISAKAPSAAAPSTTPTTPPANAIARPQWAE